MADIIKIVIKGSSGFVAVENIFHDCITITPASISYEYSPLLKTDANPKRKWLYETTSPSYRRQFDTIAEMLPSAFAKPVEYCVTDIGSIEFWVTYSDKTRHCEVFTVFGDHFYDLFHEIRRLVPEYEEIPEVLMTSDDYPDEDED